MRYERNRPTGLMIVALNEEIAGEMQRVSAIADFAKLRG